MKKILDWAKKNLFLVVVVFIYTFFALFHLGDFSAPQTFHSFDVGEEFYIILSKEENVSKIMLYTGPTYGDTTVEFSNAFFGRQAGFHDMGGKQGIEFYPDDFYPYKEEKLKGPFKWFEISLHKKTATIRMRNNATSKPLNIGEIAVFNEADKKIKDIKIGTATSGIVGEDHLTPELYDEQDIVPLYYDAMNSSYFDEVYFAETAYEYAHGLKGYEIVHPPLGKIIQSIPIYITGRMSPFTWRVMGALTGVAIIIVMYYLTREIFYKDKNAEKFARITLVLASLSNLAFVQTRLGTVDSYLCLFTILSVLFMIKFTHKPEKLSFLALSGIFFGCAFATKWSGAFVGLGLAYLYFRKKHFKDIRKCLKYGALFFLVIPAVIYFGSYLLFPKTTGAKNVGDVITQGKYLYDYHSSEDTPHSAMSKWYTWPISLVPFYYAENHDGSSIWLTGNYAICYMSVIALVITGYFAIWKRDKSSIYIIVMYLALLLPYAFISRPMFLYHYLPASCFSILAISNAIKLLAPKSKAVPIVVITLAAISFVLLYKNAVGI